MPELQAPQEPKDIDLERIPFLFEQEPDDEAAVSLVRKTFSTYEPRRKDHEDRWRSAERLYCGVVDERYWEGTKVKRASLAVPIVYDQIEAAYPLITSALFSFYPTFFETVAQSGSTPADAARIRDIFADILHTPPDESSLSAVSHMKIAIRQMEKLGDGVIELSWDAQNKRPIVEWADLRDLYFDPTAPGPLIDLSPSIIHRKLMSVDDLASLRGTKGVKIPNDEMLNYMAKMRYMSSGDLVKRDNAMSRKETYNITDMRVDPRHQLIEVMVYWSKDRLIWTLARVWTAINEKNPFGFIPYCKAPYTIVEGRPYSMSLPDVLVGEQKYAQGIRNSRLDNLALALNPPRTRAQGAPTTPAQTAWRPGLEDRVNKVDEVEVSHIENITPNAYQEEQLIHAQAAKRTGINDMTQSGVPTPSNANRSATGVNQQASAVNQRLRTAVENVEDYMIVPMLYKVQAMVSKFAPEVMQVPNAAGEQVPVSRTDLSKPVKFRMEASSRMVTKDKLAMFLGPVSQLLFNDALMHQANMQGKTLDFAEWERFFQDATMTSRSYQFFRDMNPQEQQALNQPDPKTQADMQKTQMELQTRMQLGQMKAQTEVQKTKMQTDAAQNATGESSARDILKILQQERDARLEREAVKTMTPPKKSVM